MNKEEFKRLERADTKARKKGNKQALYDWGMQLERQLMDNLTKQYEERFREELLQAIDCFLISLMYTLHFSEKTKFGPKRLNEVMKDINATVDMFKTGEYSPEEYREILAKDGIFLNKEGKKDE